MTARGPALLHLASDVGASVRADFDRWSEEHLRGNLDLPGFVRARRLARSASWPGAGTSMEFLTLFELESPDALVSEANASRDGSVPEAFLPHLRFQRSIFRELDPVASPGDYATGDYATGPAIFHVISQIDAGFEDDFQRWYAGEHVPAVLTTPGMLGVRRFVRIDDPAGRGLPARPYTCLAIFEMEDVRVVEKPEGLRAAKATPCPTEVNRHRKVSHHVFEEFFSAP